jgi:hypothetical protein
VAAGGGGGRSRMDTPLSAHFPCTMPVRAGKGLPGHRSSGTVPPVSGPNGGGPFRGHGEGLYPREGTMRHCMNARGSRSRGRPH